MLKLNIGVIISTTLVALCQCSVDKYVPAPIKVASNPFVKKFVGILKKEDIHKNQISSNLGVKIVGNVPSHDTPGFVDPFYGKSGHNVPVKDGTGNNLLPGVSYVTADGSSGDRKKINVHGSAAKTGGHDFVDPFYSNSNNKVPTHVDPYKPIHAAATPSNSQHKLLPGVSYVTDDSYSDNWSNDVQMGSPSNTYIDNAINDFVDPFYGKKGNSHIPTPYMGNGGSPPSSNSYRSDYAQYINHNSDQFVDPFYAKKGNPTNYHYNADNSHPSIGSSSWSDVFNKKGLVFVEWPLKSQKSTEPNVVCMDKRNSVPSVYIKIEGLEDPLCMHLKVPKHKQKILIKHGDESLGIKTSLCESTVKKEVYSADYINAAYIPDHQVTMYPDMILEDLTFRQWNDGEICDLPFPSKQMKIKACRSDGSLRGLQFYIDASTPNTDYSGILGPLANMKLHKFDTHREGQDKTVANIVVKNANKKYEFKSVLRYGVSRLSQQCWETTDTDFLNLD